MISKNSNSSENVSILRFLALFFGSLGILLRVRNLDLKPFWQDEIYTMYRTVGIGSKEIDNAVLDKILSHADSLSLLSITHTSWADAWNVIMQMPEHAPLYFLGLRGWLTIFPETVSSIRLFSVFLSILSLPLFYWLGYELLQTRMAAWCTLGFASVSPILLRYAQESRPYSLWISIILLSTLLLVRALRQESTSFNRNWFFYALLIAVSFYTSLLSVLLLCTHASIIFFCYIPKFLKIFNNTKINVSITSILTKAKNNPLHKKSFLWILASLAGITLSLPWLTIILKKRNTVVNRTAWLKDLDASLFDLIKSWFKRYTAVVLDLSLIPNKSQITIITLFAVLVGLLIFYIFKHSQTQKIGILSGATLLALSSTQQLLLIGGNIVIGGGHATLPRYSMILFVGVVLTLGVAFGLLIKRVRHSRHKYISAILVLVSVWSISTISCFTSTEAKDWDDQDRLVIHTEKVLDKYSEIDSDALFILGSSTCSDSEYLSLLVSIDSSHPGVLLREDQEQKSKIALFSQLQLDKKPLILIKPSRKLKKELETLRGQKLQTSLHQELEIYYLPTASY